MFSTSCFDVGLSGILALTRKIRLVCSAAAATAVAARTSAEIQANICTECAAVLSVCVRLNPTVLGQRKRSPPNNHHHHAIRFKIKIFNYDNSF